MTLNSDHLYMSAKITGKNVECFRVNRLKIVCHEESRENWKALLADNVDFVKTDI